MKNAAGQAVTMEHVLTYVTDELKVEVARKALWRYLIDHGFVYKLATPRDSLRIVSRENEIVSYYQNLENDLEGVHPSLVFNVDEMGAEMFADRKEVRVFVRPENVPEDWNLYVGVPRSSRRCTLVACIALDGVAVIPTILTRTKTVNSWLFERGYSNDNLRIYSAEKSFMTADIFQIWLDEVFSRRSMKGGA